MRCIYYMQIDYCRVESTVARVRRRAVRVPANISSGLRTRGLAYCLASINITDYGKLISTLQSSQNRKVYSFSILGKKRLQIVVFFLLFQVRNLKHYKKVTFILKSQLRHIYSQKK